MTPFKSSNGRGRNGTSAGHASEAALLSPPALVRSLVGTAVIPELLVRHAGRLRTLAADPHVPELTRLLLGTEPERAFRLIERCAAESGSIAKLCATLCEPAARVLGDLWKADTCSEWEVDRGLRHLHVALRRAAFSVDGLGSVIAMPRAVLAAPPPREPHLLGTVIASEVFTSAGWDVSQEYPNTDTALSKLVHERWFDVLDLSLSVAMRREHRLPALAESIHAARVHSRNPGLIVIVDGRIFHEEPQACSNVGADAYSPDAMALMAFAARPLQIGDPRGLVSRIPQIAGSRSPGDSKT